MSILLCGDKISCHLFNNSSIIKDLLFEHGSMWGGEGFN
jgi:NifU-like protein involved in Fe-S cluster formation